MYLYSEGLSAFSGNNCSPIPLSMYLLVIKMYICFYYQAVLWDQVCNNNNVQLWHARPKSVNSSVPAIGNGEFIQIFGVDSTHRNRFSSHDDEDDVKLSCGRLKVQQIEIQKFSFGRKQDTRETVKFITKKFFLQ